MINFYYLSRGGSWYVTDYVLLYDIIWPFKRINVFHPRFFITRNSLKTITCTTDCARRWATNKKTACRTRYAFFEFLVMPFEVCSVYLLNIFHEHLDIVFVVIYLMPFWCTQSAPGEHASSQGNTWLVGVANKNKLLGQELVDGKWWWMIRISRRSSLGEVEGVRWLGELLWL